MFPDRIHNVLVRKNINLSIERVKMNDINYESQIIEAIELKVITSDNQEMDLAASRSINEKKYSIKKLNSRIWIDKKDNDMHNDMFAVMSKVCRSSKDILIFRNILIKTDNNHIFSESAIQLSQDMRTTRSFASTFIKKCVDENLLYKKHTNKYLVNPFLFTPVGANAQSIQSAQFEWREIEFKSMVNEAKENQTTSTLINSANELIDTYRLTYPLSYLIQNKFFLSILDQFSTRRKLTTKQEESLINSFTQGPTNA